MVIPHVKISREGRKALSDSFGVTAGFLTKALWFTANSARAREIRCHAVNILKCDAIIERKNVF